jgi:hypothetical protein
VKEKQSCIYCNKELGDYVKCPRCNEKTKVLDTRTKSSSKARVWVGRNIPAVRNKKDIDWRYRKRVCTSCQEVSYSIEYIVSDLNDLIEEQKKGSKS